MTSTAAVTLDAYGTLFEGGSDDLIRLVEELVEESPRDVTVEQALRRREELIRELTRREFLNMRDRDTWILTTLFEEYGIDRDPEPVVEALNRTYYRVHPYPDAIPCIEALRDRGVRLAVVSNADVDMMQDVLRAHGLTDAFDAVVTSEHAKTYKPARAIFRAATDALDVDPSATWHVGDSYTADVVGAKDAGLRAAWLRRPGGLPAPEQPAHEPDAAVTTLAQIPALL